MNAIKESRHLSVTINRSADEAYDFLAQPLNFGVWASGLGALERDGGQWTAQTPEGTTQVRFSDRNELGVLDHWVTTPGGEQIYLPLRVVANGPGCDLIFILFRRPGMDDQRFNADAQWVMKDLQAA